MNVDLHELYNGLEEAEEAVEDTHHEVVSYRTNINLRKLGTDGIINSSSADEAVTEMEEAISGNVFADLDVQSNYSENPDNKVEISYDPSSDSYSVRGLVSGLEREEAELERSLEDAGLSVRN